jgi:hypothetical protein
MTIRSDPAEVDLKYRAKRTAQRPADYAAAVEIYRRPTRTWPIVLVTVAVLLAALYLGVRP